MIDRGNITCLVDQLDEHVSFATSIKSAVAGMEVMEESVRDSVCATIYIFIERLQASQELATTLNEASRQQQETA